jgi:hypothetical protein
MLRAIIGFYFHTTDRNGVAKGLGKLDNADDLEMAEIVLRHVPSR